MRCVITATGIAVVAIAVDLGCLGLWAGAAPAGELPPAQVALPASSLAPASVLATDALTVEGAVRLTIANHPAVAQAEHGVAAAEARIGSSRSPRYPDLALSGAYTRIAPVPEIDVLGRAMRLAPGNNYDVHLGLRQTIYDFGRTGTAIDIARAGRDAAADYVEQVKSGLAYRTITAFNSIMILRESVAVLDDQISALNQHIEVSRNKVRAGTATDFDVLTTQVRTAAATNDRIDAASNLEAQEIVLRQLVGLPSEAPVRLSGDFVRTERPLDTAALLAAAFAERPEMTAARDVELTAGLQVRLASLGDRPSLALSLSSGLKTGYPDNLNQLKANYAAGFDFRVPIFNGHRTRNQRREAEAGLRSAQARTEDLKREVTAEVEQAIARAGASWEKTKNAEVLVRQAEAAVTMAGARYEAGVVTNLDLLDAQTTLTQARLGYLRSLFAYSMSLAELDRATGKKVW
jgi:outer membrane protein